jgi:hypothetical protein
MKKFGKKKYIIISIAIILVAVLVVGAVHASTDYLPAPLRKWEKKQLIEAMGDTPEYYFGEYNGYYVVSAVKLTQDLREETIGGYTFCFNEYTISVWKGGIGFDLKYAYEQGKISDKDLAKIYKYQKQTEEDLYGHLD